MPAGRRDLVDRRAGGQETRVLDKEREKKLFSKPPISDREPLQKTPDSNNRDTTVSEKTTTICTVPPNFNSDYY